MMATRPPPSSSSSSSSSDSSTTASPPTVSQPKVSGTSASSTPSNYSAPPPQSPPPAAIPPPTSAPPSPPPSPPSPPAGSPPVASPQTPLVSSPPPPSQVSPPKSSPTPPTSASPPPSPPTKALSPPPANSPPSPLAKPPQNSPPTPPDSPPALQPPKSFPSPLLSNSPIPPPAAPSNSSVNGTTPMPPIPFFPPENPTAKSATSGPDMTNIAPKVSGGAMSSGMGLAIGIVVGFLALSLVVMAVWFMQKRKRRVGLDGGYGMPSPFASSQNSDSPFLRPQKSAHLAGSGSGSNFVYSPEPGGMGNSRLGFTYEDLANATDRFSTHNLLGEGGFGCVYKGCLLDGREIAVKQLKIGGGQGEREFRAEVEIISRVHHRHLVTLVGYCISEHQRLLVYQYVPNNTLHYHLHGEGRPVMKWETRVKVATGAARGIAYLHEDCHPRIIHRDIKSTNILLDNSFEAWVADFGLAKLALDANTHVTTRVMGTFGYMAPEYASSGKLTEKSDVFSFGVVLLELITGRKPVDASQPLGDESLVEWARPLLSQALESENFEELIDPRLEKNYVETEMFRMIEAAAVCIRHLASKRPRMSQVVRALDSITDITNGMKPGQSEIFNSREQSAQIRMFQRMAFGSQDCSLELLDRSQSRRMSRD